MGRGRREYRYRRADDVLQSGSSGAVHTRRTLGVGADLAGGSQAARVHRDLRYVGLPVSGLRSVDGGQCRSGRAAGHHDATFLSRAFRAGDQLEDLHRAAGSHLGAGFRWKTLYVPSSLNLLATRSVIAVMAASASGPAAETTMDVPGPADSIISPMMEVPPTVSPPRVTQTSALKRTTS